MNTVQNKVQLIGNLGQDPEIITHLEETFDYPECEHPSLADFL